MVDICPLLRGQPMLTRPSFSENACRLCGGETDLRFTLPILSKHTVAYLKCARCGSLQTERPHWLDEAYGASNLAKADAGAVARCLCNQAAVYTISRALGFGHNARVLDFAGGNGLLCRLLRDVGFDARTADAFAVNDFAQGFDDKGGNVDIVCAFEVAEHFANPVAELASIFDRATRAVIMSTKIYTGQGPGWWYLAPREGQHVFFYSQAAMHMIADRFGFHYLRAGGYHLFIRVSLRRARSAALVRLLRGRPQRVIRGYLAYRLSFDRAAADGGLA